MTRRSLAAGLIGLTAKADRPITGSIIDDSHRTGHRLRDRGQFPAPRRTVRAPVVIIGGGMAGLSAAWRLDKRGFHDFVLLEMESQPGGNSRWGENEVSAYPWAAHYVPVPDRRATLVRELMEELGVLRDGVWEERHLCHTPQERLFLHGRWQEGLEPEVAATRRDHDEYRRFHQMMDELGGTGEFAVPFDLGHRRRRELDRIAMSQWLRDRDFQSPYLHWLVDYSCRDDYGATSAATSAWAGLHYFASRGDRDDKGPLTWPEGNGWIASRLSAKLKRHIVTGAFVHRLDPDGRGWRVFASGIEYRAAAVIFAAPTFLARYLMERPPAVDTVYSPWLTANLTLDRWPRERGLPAAWDNVIYQSPSLGYVVATHQSLRTRIDRTVWTYYWALAHGSPTDARRQLLDKDWSYWKEAILKDLARAHPDIRECVTRIDILRLGHAMARPVPGFLTSESRARLFQGQGTLLWANSDLSGFSIFEEAQYRGVTAADRALRLLGR